MPRNTVSIFLALIFLAFLSAPSIISFVDSSIDVSILYASSEEEENGNEKPLDVEIIFSKSVSELMDFKDVANNNNTSYFFKKYPKPHLNLIFPPPEEKSL